MWPDGPGFEPRSGRDFPDPCRPTSRHTQLPNNGYRVSFSRSRGDRGLALANRPLLTSGLGVGRVISLPSFCAFMTSNGMDFVLMCGKGDLHIGQKNTRAFLSFVVSLTMILPSLPTLLTVQDRVNSIMKQH